MGIFYLDVETTGLDQKEDKLLTIQFQELDVKGKPIGDLKILKEWESSEEEIVKRFYDVFMSRGMWEMIPIMNNNIFDFSFLFEKFKKYCNWNEDPINYLFDKPFIDIKSILVIMNEMSFKGSGLNNFTEKSMDGSNVPIWYSDKEYDKIEEYIKMETESFLKFFQKLIKEIPKIRGRK